QAEDGIRDPLVTGVQSVLFRSNGHDGAAARVEAEDSIADAAFLPALVPFAIVGMPAGWAGSKSLKRLGGAVAAGWRRQSVFPSEIGRALCRERAAVMAGGGLRR